jgi:feruloyl esterase
MVSPVNPATLPPDAGLEAMFRARVPGWDPAKIGTVSETTPLVQALSKLVDAGEDWSAFLKKGTGRFILYMASADYQVNAQATAHFYEQALKKNDRAAMERSTRFYMAPNGGHGSYGISATTGEELPHFYDLVTVLADWVEKGMTPPDWIPQTLKEAKPPYTVTRSKPICRYPNYPRYNGSGDPMKAESYRCAPPTEGSRTSAR